MVETTDFDDDGDSDEDVVANRRLDTDQDAPATQIVDVVAELEDADPIELPPIYRCIDDLVAGLFSSPPPSEAEAHLTFTYHRYRIHVEQDGTTTVRHPSAES